MSESESESPSEPFQNVKQIFTRSLIICLGSIYFGYMQGMMNIGALYLENQDKNIVLLVTIIGPLGACFSCLLTGFILLEKLGRRKILIMADIIGIFGCSIFWLNGTQSIAQYQIDTTARFFMGISSGINTILVPIYIRQYSPIEIYSITGSFNQVFINVGIFTSYIITSIPKWSKEGDVENSNWSLVQFSFFFPAIMCLCRLIFLKFIYKDDTPFYYAVNKQIESLRKVIETMYHENQVDQIMKNLIKQSKLQREVNKSFQFIFNIKSAKHTYVCIMLSIFQQLSGINAIIYNSNTIISSFTNKKTSVIPQVATILIGLLLALFAYISGSRILRIYGRRDVLKFGVLGCAVSTGFCSLFSFLTTQNSSQSLKSVTLIGIFLFVISFGFSIGPILWIYSAEILHDKGFSLVASFNWGFVAIVIIICNSILNDQEIKWLYLCFLICNCFAFYLINRYVVETKDRKFHEIGGGGELGISLEQSNAQSLLIAISKD